MYNIPPPKQNNPSPPPLQHTHTHTRTHTINLQLDPRAQDLVPAVYAPDQPSAALEAAGAAEGVREGGVGGEVFLDRGALGAGRGLREGVDDVGDFGDLLGGVSYGVRVVEEERGGGEGTWVFHCGFGGGVLWGGEGGRRGVEGELKC